METKKINKKKNVLTSSKKCTTKEGNVSFRKNDPERTQNVKVIFHFTKLNFIWVEESSLA